ncbi:hypothetical protein LTR36_003736 [Oleoguttula mirabilis]|uniref:Uncharacterized protein n=1 Tax=Oleoguttula mirabilis TaxID=1507867 RepID=A0AAV9JID7_9PEZI|nr:hypothetical protein LTR36_003736 [Oleoguttula mirabilis]
MSNDCKVFVTQPAQTAHHTHAAPQGARCQANLSASSIPAKIHLMDLDSFPGIPVSYMGDGWYRPVLPVPDYHGSIRPRLSVTRAEVRAAAAQFNLRHVLAKPVEESSSPSASEQVSPSQHDRSVPHERSVLQSIPVEDVAMEGVEQKQPVVGSPPAGDLAHVTQLRDYPGVAFRAVGGGQYVRDASRSGEWVVVPHTVGRVRKGAGQRDS